MNTIILGIGGLAAITISIIRRKTIMTDIWIATAFTLFIIALSN